MMALGSVQVVLRHGDKAQWGWGGCIGMYMYYTLGYDNSTATVFCNTMASACSHGRLPIATCYGMRLLAMACDCSL